MTASTPSRADRRWFRSTASVDIGRAASTALLMIPSPWWASVREKLRAGATPDLTGRPHDLLQRPGRRGRAGGAVAPNVHACVRGTAGPFHPRPDAGMAGREEA